MSLIPTRCLNRLRGFTADIPASVLPIMAARSSWFLIPLSPVTVVYLYRIGLSHIQILNVFTLFLCISAVLDVPSSILSEIFSKRRALVLACICKGIGGALLVAQPSYHRVLLAYVFIAVANGIFSGVDVSLLIGECEAVGLDRPAIRSVQTRSYLWTTVVSFISAFIGGVGGWSFGLATIAFLNAATAWAPLACSVMYLRRARAQPTRTRLVDLVRPVRQLFSHAGRTFPLAGRALSSHVLDVVFLAFIMGNLLWIANLSQIRLGTILMQPVSVGLFACVQITYAVPLARFIRRRGPLFGDLAQPAVITVLMAISFALIWQSAVLAILLGNVVLEYTRTYVMANVHARVTVGLAPEYRASMLSLLGVASKAMGAAILALVAIDPGFISHYIWALACGGVGLQAVMLGLRIIAARAPTSAAIPTAQLRT